MSDSLIKLINNVVNYSIDLIGFLAIVFLIGMPLYFYNVLPEVIPTHFNIKGNADGFSDKVMLWILPSIGTFIFISIYGLCKLKLKQLEEEELVKQDIVWIIKIIIRFVRLFNSIIVCCIAYLTYSIIRVSLGKQSVLGINFMPIIYFFIFSPLIYFLAAYLKRKKIKGC